MNVSLNQAIEIHAKVLAHRFGDRAPLLAREKAHHCSASGDDEGHAVWLRVPLLLKCSSRRRTDGINPSKTHRKQRDLMKGRRSRTRLPLTGSAANPQRTIRSGLKLPVTYHVVIAFDRIADGDLKLESLSPIGASLLICVCQ